MDMGYSVTGFVMLVFTRLTWALQKTNFMSLLHLARPIHPYTERI
jgi:hypothetical protein